MQGRKLLFIFVMLILLSYSTYSLKIFGFNELRYDGLLILNSTSFMLKTNDIESFRITDDGIGNFSKGLDISEGLRVGDLVSLSLIHI